MQALSFHEKMKNAYLNFWKLAFIQNFKQGKPRRSFKQHKHFFSAPTKPAKKKTPSVSLMNKQRSKKKKLGTLVNIDTNEINAFSLLEELH